MTKILILLITLTLIGCSEPKEQKNVKNNSESKEEVPTDTSGIITYSKMTPTPVCESYTGYFEFRNENHPIYYGQKVDSVIRHFILKAQEKNENIYDRDFFDIHQIQKLTIEELIYYCLEYPADFAQICSLNLDRNPFKTKKIYAYLPFRHSDYDISVIQMNELKRRRIDVISSFKKYFDTHPTKIKRDYAEILKQLNAWEIFPEIIKYASEKQLVCYTLLLEIMHKSNYKKLKQSKIYPMLYGENTDYFSAGVESKQKNREEIIRLAKEFYSDMNGD